VKIEKHTNWEYENCQCSDRNNSDPYADSYYEILLKQHEEHVWFASYVRDLLDSLDAEQQLKDGFNGMGHNILVEQSGRRHTYIRKLKEMLGEK
jgi:hypothetical protein